ncbi:MAG: enoyl-CoA hydratase/isomerase family protein [Burkholderiales bacterium]|nr:enoyl-CoA hydratase/isomerase family protein [Burkholderiales bacterium]
MNAAAFANPLLQTPTRGAPRRIAVVGAGTIGPDIAYYLKSALPALELTLLDVRQAAIDAALARLRGYADKAVARRKMSAEAAAATLAGLTGSNDYDSLAGCDWVLEAATEDLALKRRIFADVEARVGAQAVITSNTSSLPAARIFQDLAHPERATVTHFFAPAWRNPAVEVIDWPALDRELLAWLRRFFAETGKLPLVTKDAACFMLDRVFDNWCNDAALLLEHATAAQIDTVASEFVHAGPFFVLNLAHGNPIIIETNTLQAEEEGEHYRPAPIFASVQTWKTNAPGERAELTPERAAIVRERLLGVLWSQTVDILDRGIGSAADLDLGCRVALGFKAGPLELMEQCGDDMAARVLQRYAEARPGMPMPRRALPAYRPGERHVLVDRVHDREGGGGDDVVVITLRRPEALNALHDAMTDDILHAIRRHEDDATVAGFVITGYGQKAFCAGGDIGRFPTLLGNADGAAQYARDCSRLLVHLDAARKPVVAAIQGMALGGGFELAMRCHALVAQRQAWFQLPEVSLGILPAIGAMVVPFRRWPQAAPIFQRMLTRAERLRAADAHAAGIVAELAEDFDDLIARAAARVRLLARQGRPPRPAEAAVTLPPFAPAPTDGPLRAADGRVLSPTVVRVIEQGVLDAAAAPSLGAALEVGYRAFGEVSCTDAAREGIQAFLEHRDPDFTRTG